MAQYHFRNIFRQPQFNVICPKCCKLNLFFSTVEESWTDKKLLEITHKSVEKDGIRPRAIYNLKHYKEMSEYLDSSKRLRNIKSLIPANFMTRKFTRPNSMFIIDSEVAREICKIVEPYLKSQRSHIVEVNAGIGLLTKNLLKANIQRLRIYESDTELHNSLHITIHNSNSDAKLFKANLLLIWNMILRDRNDFANRFNKAFDGIPCYSWNDEPVMKLIATIPNEIFLLHMMYSIIFQSGICVYGRPELFITMPSSAYFKLVAKPEEGTLLYRSKSVLFQILFENMLLNKLPGKAFVPWLKINKDCRSKTRHDPDTFYLVKVTARQDLFERIPAHLLKPLWFFIHSMMRKRSANLISIIENWIPGCGPRLIQQGYTIFSKCGSLTPEEYVKLFLEFSSWPDFKSSSFLPTMQSVMMKMTESGIVEELLVEQLRNVKN